MRKGSSSLGSLGLVPSGIALLILPLLSVTAPFVLGPAPARAAQATPRQKAETPSKKQPEQQERKAVDSRRLWLASTNWLRAKRAKLASAAAKLKIRKVIQTRATWYGPGFHGRRTASGERFNQYAMTLASRHLPFGTRVRVVNLRTGKSAIARVNDRGPFRKGYTADLSKGLAQKIGLGGSGPIRLEILAQH